MSFPKLETKTILIALAVFIVLTVISNYILSSNTEDVDTLHLYVYSLLIGGLITLVFIYSMSFIKSNSNQILTGKYPETTIYGRH